MAPRLWDCPVEPTETARPSVKASAWRWHVAHAIVSFFDRRAS